MSHTYKTTADRVHPAMGVKLDGRVWFVRDVKDIPAGRRFSLESTSGGAVGIYPPETRTMTAGRRSELTAVVWS